MGKGAYIAWKAALFVGGKLLIIRLPLPVLATLLDELPLLLPTVALLLLLPLLLMILLLPKLLS